MEFSKEQFADALRTNPLPDDLEEWTHTAFGLWDGPIYDQYVYVHNEGRDIHFVLFSDLTMATDDYVVREIEGDGHFKNEMRRQNIRVRNVMFGHGLKEQSSEIYVFFDYEWVMELYVRNRSTDWDEFYELMFKKVVARVFDSLMEYIVEPSLASTDEAA